MVKRKQVPTNPRFRHLSPKRRKRRARLSRKQKAQEHGSPRFENSVGNLENFLIEWVKAHAWPQVEVAQRRHGRPQSSWAVHVWDNGPKWCFVWPNYQDKVLSTESTNVVVIFIQF